MLFFSAPHSGGQQNSSQIHHRWNTSFYLSAVSTTAQVAAQMYRKKSNAAFEQFKLKTLIVIHIYLPA